MLRDKNQVLENILMKAVITCGGIGSRLLPFTKVLPKEMLPVFVKTEFGIEVKPLVQLIFENLFDAGIRDFCFIIGRTKRSIEEHFTPDFSDNKSMKLFYKKILNSKIFWITQNEPNGFGDAVRYASSFVGIEKFIVQAGDVAVIQRQTNLIKKLIELEKQDYDGVLIIRKVMDPKRHGIVILDDDKSSLVKKVIEKPEEPPSDLGIMPVYLFDSKIFSYLEKTKPGKNNEIQLTDSIEKMIQDKRKIKAIRSDSEMFWDVGTPEAYREALNESYDYKNK
jgi:UTP--glucose-1-phosphate uridylyltransferase